MFFPKHPKAKHRTPTGPVPVSLAAGWQLVSTCLNHQFAFELQTVEGQRRVGAGLWKARSGNASLVCECLWYDQLRIPWSTDCLLFYVVGASSIWHSRTISDIYIIIYIHTYNDNVWVDWSVFAHTRCKLYLKDVSTLRPCGRQKREKATAKHSLRCNFKEARHRLQGHGSR